MRRPPSPPPAAANIAAVVELERAALANRSRAERISDTIMRWLAEPWLSAPISQCELGKNGQRAYDQALTKTNPRNEAGSERSRLVMQRDGRSEMAHREYAVEPRGRVLTFREAKPFAR